MNAEDSLKLARRFIELPLEKRRLFLKALDKEGVDFSLLPIPAGVAVPDRQALSYAQQRMWFLWQLDPQSAAYNLPNAVRLSGPLDRAVLAQAFDWLLERHESLRTVFALEDDEPRQVIQEARVDIDYRELCDLDPAQRETRVQQLADAEARRPFDLQQGPLLRVCVLGLGEQEHVMLLTLHHIVADGWSMGVLIEEFLHAYDSLQMVVPNKAYSGDPGGYEWLPPAGIRKVLLMGDETALPAIAGILEELQGYPDHPDVQAFIEVPYESDCIDLRCHPLARINWLPRDLLGARHGETLIHAARELAELPPANSQRRPIKVSERNDEQRLWETAQPADNDFYAWVAGESATVMNIRRHLINERGQERRNLTLMGYWRLGSSLG